MTAKKYRLRPDEIRLFLAGDEFAVCWEEVNDAEYNHGGICTVD